MIHFLLPFQTVSSSLLSRVVDRLWRADANDSTHCLKCFPTVLPGTKVEIARKCLSVTIPSLSICRGCSMVSNADLRMDLSASASELMEEEEEEGEIERLWSKLEELVEVEVEGEGDMLDVRLEWLVVDLNLIITLLLDFLNWLEKEYFGWKVNQPVELLMLLSSSDLLFVSHWPFPPPVSSMLKNTKQTFTSFTTKKPSGANELGSSTEGLDNDLIIRCARGEETERPAVWCMRQAGRYLPGESFISISLDGDNRYQQSGAVEREERDWERYREGKRESHWLPSLWRYPPPNGLLDSWLIAWDPFLMKREKKVNGRDQ